MQRTMLPRLITDLWKECSPSAELPILQMLFFFCITYPPCTCGGHTSERTSEAPELFLCTETLEATATDISRRRSSYELWLHVLLLRLLGLSWLPGWPGGGESVWRRSNAPLSTSLVCNKFRSGSSGIVFKAVENSCSLLKSKILCRIDKQVLWKNSHK